MTATETEVTPKPSPRTIYRVLKYLADNEGAGWLEVGMGIDLADYVPESPDALPFLPSAEQAAADRREDATANPALAEHISEAIAEAQPCTCGDAGHCPHCEFDTDRAREIISSAITGTDSPSSPAA